MLLVACANVAGLLTSRAPVRAREMALRLAIGAGRGRLVRQLVTESLLIALAGGVARPRVGYAGMTLFRQIEIPTDLPIMLAFQMDRRALLFSLTVAVGKRRAVRPRARHTGDAHGSDGRHEGRRRVAPGRRRRWGRAVLVGGQVAVSVVLLAVAMFMYRGFREQLASGPGYRTDHLLMMSFDTTLIRYTDAQSQQFFEQVAERARTVPGVKSVTLSTSIPMLNDSIDAATVVPEGFQFPPGKDNATVLASSVDEHYFDTMAIHDSRRDATSRIETHADAPRVAIVNQQFAQHYWPNQDPIGKRFRLIDADNAWVQIVGVAKTNKYIFIAEPPTEFVYLPYRQQQAAADGHARAVRRRSGEPRRAAARVVRGLDANLPIYNVRTMEALYRDARGPHLQRPDYGRRRHGPDGTRPRDRRPLRPGGLCRRRRTREIGIRMAIGADRAAVLRMVLRQGLVLALVGLAVGVAASVGAGQLLQAAFPSGGDDGNIVAALLVVPIVLAVTFLAAYVPARQASRVDPILALRHD